MLSREGKIFGTTSLAIVVTRLGDQLSYHHHESLELMKGIATIYLGPVALFCALVQCTKVFSSTKVGLRVSIIATEA